MDGLLQGYELIENANAIMETFTTFYLQDYNDMVSMRLLLAFPTISLSGPSEPEP